MSLGFIEKEEKKIRKIKFRRKRCGGEREKKNIISLGFSCLACTDIVLRYVWQYVDPSWDGSRYVDLLVRSPESWPCLLAGEANLWFLQDCKWQGLEDTVIVDE